jgi:hypothetical protein
MSDRVPEIFREKSAEINMSAGFHGSALCAASSGDHEAIVQLLLEKGAEVNMSYSVM